MSLRYTMLQPLNFKGGWLRRNTAKFSLRMRKRQNLVSYHILYYMSVTSSGREVEHREVVTVVRGESLFSG